MVSPEMIEFAKGRGSLLLVLAELLEPEHLDEFVAIEPESGDYFLGDTLARLSARRQLHPDRPRTPCGSGTRRRFISGCIVDERPRR